MNFSDSGIGFSVKFDLGNHILDIFFRANGRHCGQVKAKNPKTAQYLKSKLTWEIEKSI